MKILQAISRENAMRINFQPIAEIAVSVVWFKDNGVKFYSDIDDLDQYEFAPFWLDGIIIALMHYVHNPSENVMLLVAQVGSDEANVKPYVFAAAENFGLPLSCFTWRENGERVSFSKVGATSVSA